MKSPVQFQSEEQVILRRLRRHGLVGRPLLLAVSGGCDSMAMLAILHRLNLVLKNEIAVAHIHHGPAATVKMRRFRDEARVLVKQQAAERGLAFFTMKKTGRAPLRSESECREFRWQSLREIRSGWRSDALILTAHHRDDLLETQLLRLIRGTSISGLRGMSFRDDDRVRPLLNMTRAEIEKLAKTLHLTWIDDPSNASTDPLRNWLRQKWLPMLEKKQRGATGSLARSLATIADELTVEKNETFHELSRQKFMSVEPRRQRQLVAGYLRELGVHDYSQGQIEEIIRRLDNRRGEFTFTILKHEWRINAEQIRAAKIFS